MWSSKKSPLRSSKEGSKIGHMRQRTGTPTKSDQSRNRRVSQFESRGDDPRQSSLRKEQPPIIINGKENLQYKPPSSIHETVV